MLFMGRCFDLAQASVYTDIFISSAQLIREKLAAHNGCVTIKE
ncbi:MAG: hypothetical protein ACI9LM_000732 [Alteromonadaceae bacterium]|jgi:hypothetical protein